MQRHSRRGAPCQAVVADVPSLEFRDAELEPPPEDHPRHPFANKAEEPDAYEEPTNAHAYGSESMDHLTAEFKTQCARRTDKGFVELVQKMFFDPQKPENRSLRARNLKNNIVQVFDGRSWMHHRKKDIVPDLFERARAILLEHYEEHRGLVDRNLSPTMRNHVRDWMEDLEYRDDKVVASLESTLFLLVLNHTPKAAARRSQKFEIG